MADGKAYKTHPTADESQHRTGETAMSRWERLAYVNQIYGTNHNRLTAYQQTRRILDEKEAEAMQTARQVADQMRKDAAEAGEVIPPPAREFYTAGKAIFTVELPAEFAEEHNAKKQYTYRISKVEKNEKYPESFFVSMLTGSDNQNDYSYLGKLDPNTGRVWTTAKSIIGQDSLPMKLLNRVLVNIWTGTPELITAAGFFVHHEGKCAKCGRPLTDSESVKIGMGPTCRGKDF